MDRVVDCRRVNLDADRQSKQCRDLEGFERAHEQNDQRRGCGGPRQTDGDAPGDLEKISAAHHRGFLERGIHRAKGGAHQQKSDRRIVQAVDPDHAGDRIDVDKRRIGVEGVAHHEIDDADLGATEENPRHREQDSGNDQRHQRQREEQRLERRIGALVDPGEQCSKTERQGRAAERELQRIDEQPHGVRRSHRRGGNCRA